MRTQRKALPPYESMLLANYLTKNMDIRVKGKPEGACIPVCYILSESLKDLGVAARVVETQATVKAMGDMRTAQIQPNESTGFLGHCVVYLPTKKWVIDASLNTQYSEVLRLAMPNPEPIYIRWDHKINDSATVELERGVVEYTTFKLHDLAWRRANFDWHELDALSWKLSKDLRRRLK